LNIVVVILRIFHIKMTLMREKNKKLYLIIKKYFLGRFKNDYSHFDKVNINLI